MHMKHIGIVSMLLTLSVSCGNQVEHQAKMSEAEELAQLAEWRDLNPRIAHYSVNRKINGKYNIRELLKNIRQKNIDEHPIKGTYFAGEKRMEDVLDMWFATLEYDIHKSHKLTREELLEQLQTDFIQKHEISQELRNGYARSGDNWFRTAYFPRIKSKISHAFDSDYSEEYFGFRMGEERVLLTSIELYRNIFRHFTTRQAIHNNFGQFFRGSVGQEALD